MKRFSFRRHRRLAAFTSALLLVILLLIVFQKTTAVAYALNGVRGALAFAGTSASGFIEQIFSSKVSLLEENGRLKAQVERYAAEAAGAAMLEDENEALRALVDYEAAAPVDFLVGSIISRASLFSEESILISRGEHDGVQVGDAVVALGGMYIGRIVRVGYASSVARLLTDSQSKVAVRMLNQAETIGIAEGQDGVLLRVNFIPQSAELQINQLLVTSGLDPRTPAGLIVGTVREVRTDEHNPFQEALIEPMIDLRRLTVVAILRLPEF